MKRRNRKNALARPLAHAFLIGDPDLDAILNRGEIVLGRGWPWLRATARRYLRRFTGQTRPRHRDVVGFLLADRSFRFACTTFGSQLTVANRLIGPEPMQPRGIFASLPLPPLNSVAALAAWLRLDIAELEWFADLKGLSARSTQSALRHYKPIVLAKPGGDIRLIEAPKIRLKHIQRRILTGILDVIPPHPAAHGFLKHRSVRSYVAPHVARAAVLRMDLRCFFPSIRRSRVQAIFRTLGYPEHVADMLGALCTTSTSPHIWRNCGIDCNAAQLQIVRDLYRPTHLPQGAPTSPAIANLCCWRLDQRLAGLAQSAGATYTRYADDLAFSGDEAFAKHAARFATHVAAISMEEGFPVHHRKTRLMRPGVRQHLAGIVINQRSNIPRPDFDQLKAILTNCIRTGPDAQNPASHPNFRAHLSGRIAFVESIHPARGLRLRALFQRIEWPD
ncbi:MAG TPA: reverse transcriptase family protein [Acidobacteriaceae bacterium]